MRKTKISWEHLIAETETGVSRGMGHIYKFRPLLNCAVRIGEVRICISMLQFTFHFPGIPSTCFSFSTGLSIFGLSLFYDTCRPSKGFNKANAEWLLINRLQGRGSISVDGLIPAHSTVAPFDFQQLWISFITCYRRLSFNSIAWDVGWSFWDQRHVCIYLEIKEVDGLLKRYSNHCHLLSKSGEFIYYTDTTHTLSKIFKK